ncbi:MAG: hypothetical protein AAGN66_08740 [Acidobacteriota bacterium]
MAKDGSSPYGIIWLIGTVTAALVGGGGLFMALSKSPSDGALSRENEALRDQVARLEQRLSQMEQAPPSATPPPSHDRSNLGSRDVREDRTGTAPSPRDRETAARGTDAGTSVFPLVKTSDSFGVEVQLLDATVSGGDYIVPFKIQNTGPRRELRLSTDLMQVVDIDGVFQKPRQIAFGTNRGYYPTAIIPNGVSARGELVFTGKGALNTSIQSLEFRVQVLSGEGFTAEFGAFSVRE